MNGGKNGGSIWCLCYLRPWHLILTRARTDAHSQIPFISSRDGQFPQILRLAAAFSACTYANFAFSAAVPFVWQPIDPLPSWELVQTWQVPQHPGFQLPCGFPPTHLGFAAAFGASTYATLVFRLRVDLLLAEDRDLDVLVHRMERHLMGKIRLDSFRESCILMHLVNLTYGCRRDEHEVETFWLIQQTR